MGSSKTSNEAVKGLYYSNNPYKSKLISKMATSEKHNSRNKGPAQRGARAAKQINYA